MGWLMRDRVWRPSFAYFYVVIALWGLFVTMFPPQSVEETLGHTYTVVWSWCALVGGGLAFIGVLGPLFTIRLNGWWRQAFSILEMLAGIGIILAVLMYDTTTWATVSSGVLERLGLAILFHVLALPSIIRTSYEMVKLFAGIVKDVRQVNGKSHE